jgi:hypothetical protein
MCGPLLKHRPNNWGPGAETLAFLPFANPPKRRNHCRFGSCGA